MGGGATKYMSTHQGFVIPSKNVPPSGLLFYCHEETRVLSLPFPRQVLYWCGNPDQKGNLFLFIIDDRMPDYV
jgi:hypothetical protein